MKLESTFGNRLVVTHCSRWLLHMGGGGIQRYIRSIAKCLEGSTVESRYISVCGDALADSLGGIVLQGSRENLAVANYISYVRHLVGSAKATHIFHVHGLIGFHFVASTLIAILAGRKYVVSTHGVLMKDSLESLGVNRRIWRLYKYIFLVPALKRSAAVIALSQTEAESVSSLSEDIRVVVSYPGVEPCLSEPRKNSSCRLNIVFVGLLGQRKSIDLLFDALSNLTADKVGKEWRLDIIGNGDVEYIKQLKFQSSELGIDENIHWHGYKSGEEKSKLMQTSSVLVLPSSSESFGFVAVEAMALGLPVIVSDGNGLADIVLEYTAGTVFCSRDSGSLSDAIARYACDEVCRAEGIRAANCYQELFTLRAMGARLLEQYRLA